MKLNYISFSKIIFKNYILENKPHIAVGVSGGTDSMALIHLLNKLINKYDGKITALIINHGLRPNSFKEAKWVYNELKKNKIKSKILNINKNRIQKRNMSEARDNRYDKITSYCKKNYILHLFIAHHKDDDLETFINRKISGSDFEGLQSIIKHSVRDKINIIRPLLSFTKKEIYKYNLINNIKFIEDPSNTDPNYTRSLIRKFLFDEKSKYKKDIYKEYNFIKNKILLYKKMIWEIIILNTIYSNKNSIKLKYCIFNDYDNLIFEKILNYIYKSFFGKQKYLRSKKIEILTKQLENPNFKYFNIGSLKIRKKQRFLIFSQ